MSPDTEWTVLTYDTFQSEVLEAQTLVLVDCWASWCSSFQQINPAIHELAIAWAGHIKIGRLNIAMAEQIAAYYGIRVVPSLLFFHHGQVVLRIVGGVSKEELIHKLSPLLLGNESNRSPIACL